jgi:hypothetical protein
MVQVVSKQIYHTLGRGVGAKVTLGDGRTASAESGGFFRGNRHDALTRAIQKANSKPAKNSR